MNELIDLIKEDEGEMFVVYDDQTGKPIEAGTHVIGNPTIGYGRLLTKDNPISKKHAEMFLSDSLQETISALLHIFPWYESIDSVRADVVVSMAYNMGVPRFRGFENTIAAIEREDWETAAAEIMDSNAARDLPTRYRKLSKMMLTGERS